MQKLTGAEKISDTTHTVLDFWSWGYSTLLENTTRSVFAEFLVASALKITQTPRVEWDAVDLHYRGKKIEVKASAYLQAWAQKQHSKIIFDIALKKGWSAETNEYAPEPCRSADCYVFCVYGEKELENVDVLKIGKWQFYVISTDVLNQNCATQKSLSLKRIEALAKAVSYEFLKKEIEQVLKIE
ncbi:MAG TPA: hypothetical protein VEC36_13995 [Patescibacteria group bacterium]|nr:hypothetical protein [Patescibacteria group bacterium]